MRDTDFEVASRRHTADKGPKECALCLSTHVLRVVGRRGFCGDHTQEAFEAARTEGAKSDSWLSGNKFDRENSDGRTAPRRV